MGFACKMSIGMVDSVIIQPQVINVVHFPECHGVLQLVFVSFIFLVHPFLIVSFAVRSDIDMVHSVVTETQFINVVRLPSCNGILEPFILCTHRFLFLVAASGCLLLHLVQFCQPSILVVVVIFVQSPQE